MTDDIPGEVQACRASRAVVINIINWDLGHAELVEHSLPAGGVSVAIAGDSLVDIIVGDLGVQQGLNTSFEAEFCVIDLSSRLDEFGHAHAEDVAWLVALDDHVGGCEGILGCNVFQERCVGQWQEKLLQYLQTRQYYVQMEGEKLR